MTFDDVIADSHARTLPALTRRRIRLPWLARKADAVIGMRRAGKTWLLFQRMRELVETGTPREDLLYLNFEDERLGELTATDLQQLVDAHYRRNPTGRTRTTTFLFDEIQVVDGWERFVRRLVDTEGTHVCVTGSSAKLLSLEIATSLRGRSLSTEVFPFSFVEALDHLGLPTSPRPPAADRSRIENAALGYLQRGGFPEVQRLEEPTRARVLQEYLDVAILRDLIERHAIANAAALRRFVRQLTNSPAGAISIHKVHDDLKSQGLAVGKESLYAWLDHVRDAYVFFAIPIHSRSERARQVNPRKVYAVDPGLVTACARRGTADTGQLLETAVFGELRRATAEITYVRTAAGHEVDFLTETDLVQACATLADPGTRDRELRALRAAMAELRRDTATMVTLSEEQTLEEPEGTVRIVPFWRWCLERADAARQPG